MQEVKMCAPYYTIEEMRAKIRELMGAEILREHKRLKAAGLLPEITGDDEEEETTGPEDENPEGVIIDDRVAFS